MREIDPIADFWRWFIEHDQQLFEHYDDLALGDQLDKQLARVHPLLGWEVGPQGEDSMYFAVSPDMDVSLIELAGQVIKLCPSLDSERWSFCVGRQRRPWSEVVQIAADENALFSEVDLSQWKHLVFRVPDSELFDIVFECGEHCPLDDDELEEIAILVAISLLGEITVLEKVDQIEVVRAFEGDRAKRAKPAAWLPYAFGMKPL